MASTSSSTASALTNDSVCRYDVFVSFRGETRNSFTDHLYQKLHNGGVIPFRDNDDIDRGEDLKPEIERGIKESRASIVVLSEQYATSRWCLDELCLILKQRKERDHFVLPIFYHVDPSHVRNQEKTFEVNVKPNSKWTEDNVKRWKEALTKVGNLTGEVVSGPETEFLEKVVNIIYKRLDLIQVYRPSNLVGMNTRDKEINSWLEQSHEQILAIWGMGGSGKTTLARHIVFSNQQKFASISILLDIGSKTTDQLHQLQEKLLTDILKGKERKIPSVWQGTCPIEHALQTRKALIVLDNIVEKRQVFELLGNGIETQSKIIITTTNKGPRKWFTSKSWRCREFEMKLLDKSDSSELLCLHAFGFRAPMQGYGQLIEKAIEFCGGNPLALEVLGSSLSEGSKPIWESSLNSFERELHGRIQSVLISSYNLLPSTLCKELFLHIACLFVGKDVDYVEKILEPDYGATAGIKTLIERCLLFVSPDKKLIMHRLLQEMGRDNVDKQSCQSLAERSRIWRNSESYNVLHNKRGSEKILGLALDMEMLAMEMQRPENTHHIRMSSHLQTGSFKNMDNLKLLQLNWVKLIGSSYEDFSGNLRWLCWLGFSLDTIPSDLYMKNLVAIDMSHSCLEKFEPPESLECLKILNLKSSMALLEIRNISRLPNLETLILWNCSKLVRIHDTLARLTSLALLNITGCENLCKREQEASVVGGNDTQPPFFLPSSLKRLFFKDCNIRDINYFPLNFNDHSSLEYLNLVNSPFESLPPYEHLKNLRVLDMSHCTKLEDLLCLPSTLAELYIYYCKSLKKVGFNTNEFRLQEFGFEGCVKLSEVEGFFKLVSIAMLEKTDLGHMKWLKEYQDSEVCLVGDYELTKGRSSCIQMLYEFDIMSTSLPDIKHPKLVPEFKSESSVLSFEVPSDPKNRRLKGLNIIFKYTIKGENWVWFAKISTKNGVDMMYNPIVFGKPDEIGIWLSYWPIGNMLHVGDEINVSILVMNGLEIKGCGADLVYTDEESENETLQAINFGGNFSEFKLSTGAYYLCRCDFNVLVDVGILSPDWFRSLVGDKTDYTEVARWRKTGRPQQSYQSYTELKYVRCIIYGPESEDIYNIAEMSKSSRVDKTVDFAVEFSKIGTKDVDHNETIEGTSSSLVEKTEYSDNSRSTKKDVDINEAIEDISSSLVEKIEYSQSSILAIKRDSEKVSLNNEIIKTAHIQSMEAYEHDQPYCTNNTEHGAGSSLSLSIFAFKGLSKVNEWYDDDPFGETQVNNDLFPSLRRIGEDRAAKVNRAFFHSFLDLLNSSGFKLEVEKAVTEDHKEILFTGHSSGCAIASLATLWMLDEYTRKRGMKFPIGCVTFGTPLIGDDTLSHAVQRESWAGHFTHFVMQYDIVPRMMLAPQASIQEHLPNLFKRKVNTYTSLKTLNDQLPAEQAVAFFENVMINASSVASHDAFDLMEPTNSQKMSSSNFVNVISPYRPFGNYVFCTGDKVQDSLTPRQLLVVENPNAVLQLLFYFLQLPNEGQDLDEFALNSLAENLSYGEELNKNGMQLQNMVYLKDLNEHLSMSDDTTYDAVLTRNKALFKLSASAKLCLKAVEEAEKRKRKNLELVKRSMRKYQSKRTKPGEMIIEDMLDIIRKYKKTNMDYYEAFKLQEKLDDFQANVHRLELAKIYDVIIEMVLRKDLPDEFEVWEELADQATLFRRLTEPLDIANYYRHLKAGYGYMAVRPKRYTFTQRWYEHANVMSFERISESNFIAAVEDLKKEVEGRSHMTLEAVNEEVKKIKGRSHMTLEAVNEEVKKIKHNVLMWKSDDKIPDEDVYWGESLLSMLQEKLQ